MPLIETLTVNVAAAVGKAVAKVWLKDPGLVGATGGVIETLKKRTDDFLTVRSTNRLFQNLEDDVARRMKRLIVREFASIDEGDQNAASLAVGAALSSLDLSEALMQSDLDATRLESAVLEAKCDAFSGLGEPAQELGRRLLNECCNYIVEIAGKLPDFQAASTAELLKRDREILDDLQRVLDELDRLRPEGREDEAYRTFEDQYRLTVVQRLNRNRLFGLRLVGAGARAEELTTTYVPQALVPVGSVDSQPLELAIGDSRLMMIRGEAGVGKTTLMQWLAVQGVRRGLAGPIARWNRIPPFYLRLRDWRDANQPFPAPEQFLSVLFRSLLGRMPQEWVHRMLEQGALILVDAVDEMPAGRRQKLFEWLEELVGMFPKASFVVSSRPAALDAEQPVPLGRQLEQLGFRSFTLEPMTLYDSLALVSRWHAAVARDLVDREGLAQLVSNERALSQALRNRPAIRSLAANPLLCAMICALNWERQKHLPDDRMELYRVVLEILLEGREQAREIGVTYAKSMDHASKEKLLDDLAYYMLRNNESELTRAVAEKVIAEALPRLGHLQDTPTILLQELLERSGVLRQPQYGFVDFIHRTFMEYMGARAAVTGADLGLLVQKARDESWRDVIVFAAGHAPERDRDDLIRRLLKPPLRLRLLQSWSAEAQVTTVCCLETVRRNLNPELLAQLRGLASMLFPPADFARARLLVPAAAANPELLEGHQNRSVAEIAACIRVAVILGGERMLNVIESYVGVDGEAIDQEIARAWPAFDEETFENRVIAQRDRFFGRRLSECTPEEAECLKALLLMTPPRDPAQKLTEELQHFIAERSLNVNRLWGYTRVLKDEEEDQLSEIAPTRKAMRARTAEWRISPAIVKRFVRLQSLSSLKLGKIEPSIVPLLHELTALQSLSLDLDEPVDLEPLARLPKLAYLDVQGIGIITLDALRAATTLSELRVSGAQNYGTIDFIGADSPLQKIIIERVAVTDLQPLRDATRLQSLGLTALKIEDFAPLTSLPELSDLDITYPKLDARIPYGQLPKLRSLWLHDVPQSFYVGLSDNPGVESLVIYTETDLVVSDILPRQVIDLTLLCGHGKEIEIDLGNLVAPKLEHLMVSRATVRNSYVLDKLPALGSITFNKCSGDFGAVVPMLEARGVSVQQ